MRSPAVSETVSTLRRILYGYSTKDEACTLDSERLNGILWTAVAATKTIIHEIMLPYKTGFRRVRTPTVVPSFTRSEPSVLVGSPSTAQRVSRRRRRSSEQSNASLALHGGVGESGGHGTNGAASRRLVVTTTALGGRTDPGRDVDDAITILSREDLTGANRLRQHRLLVAAPPRRVVSARPCGTNG